MRYEGFRFLGWRIYLGFGLHIASEDEAPMLTQDENGIISNALFEGLTLSLPFVEVRWGTVWYPAPIQTEDQQDSAPP